MRQRTVQSTLTAARSGSTKTAQYVAGNVGDTNCHNHKTYETFLNTFS